MASLSLKGSTTVHSFPVPDVDECTPLLSDPAASRQDEERGKPNAPIGETSVQTRSSLEIMSIISVLFVGVFVANVDMTFMLAAYPEISSELNAFRYGSWLMTAYMLAMCATQPLYGKLSNIFGRKAMLIATCLLYALGAAMCACSYSLAQVIVGRIVGGTGGAGMICLVSITIADIVPLREVAAYRSYVNVVQVVGRSVGAPVGGLVVEKLGWRYAFAIVAPLAVGGAIMVAWRLDLGVLASKNIDEEKPSTWSRIKKVDFLGSLLLCCTIVMLLLIFSLGGNGIDWYSWKMFSLVLATLIFGTLYYAAETYWVAEPIFPSSLLGISAVITSYGTIFVANFAQSATSMSVPLFFQILLNVGPSKAGAFFVPSVIGNAIGGIGTGIYVKKSGKYTLLCYIAMVMLIVANILMAWRWGTEKNFHPVLEGFYVSFAGFGTGITHATSFVVLTAGMTAYGRERQQMQREIQDGIAITGSGMYLSGNLGATIGASLSAAILQILLKRNLAQSLSGAELEHAISKALSSIEWVQHLDMGSRMREIVVGAYVFGIKGTFVGAAVSAVIGLFLCLFIRDLSVL